MNIFKRIYDYLIKNNEINDEEKKKILNHQNNEGNTILHELAYCKSSILTNLVLKLPKDTARITFHEITKEKNVNLC